jgi:hypothetical protein
MQKAIEGTNINHTSTPLDMVAPYTPIKEVACWNYALTNESTIIYAITQMTNELQSTILYDFKHTTLQMTQSKGTISGISDFVMQSPASLLLSASHFSKIQIPATHIVHNKNL